MSSENKGISASPEKTQGSDRKNETQEKAAQPDKKVVSEAISGMSELNERMTTKAAQKKLPDHQATASREFPVPESVRKALRLAQEMLLNQNEQKASTGSGDQTKQTNQGNPSDRAGGTDRVSESERTGRSEKFLKAGEPPALPGSEARNRQGSDVIESGQQRPNIKESTFKPFNMKEMFETASKLLPKDLIDARSPGARSKQDAPLNGAQGTASESVGAQRDQTASQQDQTTSPKDLTAAQRADIAAQIDQAIAKGRDGTDAANAPGDAKSELTSSSGETRLKGALSGKLTSPDGKESLEVKDGVVTDKNGKVLGRMDQNGRVQTEGEVNATDINSLKAGWKFEGTEGDKPRSFECNNNMSSGKIFVPDGAGKPVEYEVRMGMLINKQTGEQEGRIEAPTESADGKVSGGFVIAGEPEKRIALSDVPNVVMDLKIMGEGGMQSRRLQVASTGAEVQADGSAKPGRYLNLQHEIQSHERHRDQVSKTEKSDQGIHPIDSITGARDERAAKNKIDIAQDEKVIAHVREILETGSVNADKIRSIEKLNPKTNESAESSQEKGETKKTARDNPIELPKLTSAEELAKGNATDSATDVRLVNGKMRLGPEVYEIRGGDLYKAGEDKSSGKLLPGYQVKLDGRENINLANEPRVLMQFTIAGDESKKEHRVMGLGPSRVAENGERVSGGLVAADELIRQGLDIKQRATEGDRAYFANKPYLVEAMGLDAADQALDQVGRNLDIQTRLLQEHVDFTFNNGFDNNNNSFSNNRLDACTRSTQQLLKGIGATGATAEQLSTEGQQVNKTITDSAIMAVTTVATAGAGTVFGALANAGKIGTVARIGAEIGVAATTGAVSSVVGRASSESNDLRNAATGAVDGVVSAAASAGSRLMAEAGWKSWGAYKIAEATVQTVSFNATALAREGKPIDKALAEAFDPKTVALGITAQLVGEGLGLGASKLATRMGAAEKGLVNDFIQDAANSYSNAATQSISEARDIEKERIAKVHGLKKDQVSEEMFLSEMRMDNIINHMHEAGVASLATAGATSLISHGVRRGVEHHLEKTAVNARTTVRENDSEQEISPNRNSRASNSEQERSKTNDRKSTDTEQESAKNTNKESTHREAQESDLPNSSIRRGNTSGDMADSETAGKLPRTIGEFTQREFDELHRLWDNKLNTPLANRTEDFVGDVNPIVHSWKNVTPEIQSILPDVHKILKTSGSNVFDGDLQKVDDASKLLGKKIHALDESFKAMMDSEIGNGLEDPGLPGVRAKRLELLKEQLKIDAVLEKELDRRAATLQTAVEDFANNNGLPKPTVKFQNDLDSKGSYGNGIIKLSRDELMKPHAEVVGTTFHEITHLEQDTLVIQNTRRQMEEAYRNETDPDKQVKPTPENIAAKLSADFNRPYSAEFVGNALRVNSEPLTAIHQRRADELYEAFKNFNDIQGDLKRINEQIGGIDKQLGKLSPHSEEVRIKDLQAQKDELNKEKDRHYYDRYMKAHEWDAMYTGDLAQRAAKGEWPRPANWQGEAKGFSASVNRVAGETSALPGAKKLDTHSLPQTKAGEPENMNHVRIEGAEAAAILAKLNKAAPAKDFDPEATYDGPIPSGFDTGRSSENLEPPKVKVPSFEKIIPIDDPKNILPNQRGIEIGGEKYVLEKRHPRDSWFYKESDGTSSPISPVKIHVTTDGIADLAKLQAKLIPALNKDPELKALVSEWKTFDPHISAGADAGKFPPGGTGNNAKAFTIYAQNPEMATRVQQKLDKILTDSGLGLKQAHATGNIDIIHGSSNRVGIVVDHFEMSKLSNGSQGAKFNDALSAQINAKMGIQAGERLTPKQLNEVEQKAGVRKGSLEYDDQGKLVLTRGSLDSRMSDVCGPPLIYLTEASASKTPGDLSDRPAYFAIAKAFSNPGENVVDLIIGNSKTITTPDGVGSPVRPNDGSANDKANKVPRVTAETPRVVVKQQERANQIDRTVTKIPADQAEQKDKTPVRVRSRDVVDNTRDNAFEDIARDLKGGDKLKYENAEWKFSRYNAETGDVVLVSNAKRGATARDLTELNPGKQLQFGESFTIRRSNGTLESGWVITGRNSDGSFRLLKENAIRVEVPSKDIMKSNPQLKARK